MNSLESRDDKNPGSLVALGYALAGASLLAVFALLHHPVGSGLLPADILASIRSLARIDRIVHATLALLFGFLTVAMAVFAERLGLRRLPVVAGLAGFFCAFVLTVLAAMTDGFVVPAIAAHCGGEPSAACTSEAMTLLRLSAIQIEYLTRFSFVGIAAAVVAWSVALLSTQGVPRWAGWAGLACAGCQMAALLATSGPLVPATLLVIFAAQVAWYLLAALLMIGQHGPFASLGGRGRPGALPLDPAGARGPRPPFIEEGKEGASSVVAAAVV